MSLAENSVTIRVSNCKGAEVFHLRPSLRAALAVLHVHGDFPTLMRGIIEGNLGVMLDLIAAGAGLNARPTLDLIPDSPNRPLTLQQLITAWTLPLAKFVVALSGSDMSEEPAQEAEPAQTTEPESQVASMERLFGIATGWLGWTPDVAMNATVSELIVATKAHFEMLKVVHGLRPSKESKKPKSLDEQARQTFSGWAVKADKTPAPNLKPDRNTPAPMPLAGMFPPKQFPL